MASKKPESWAVEDCIEECRVSSRSCYIGADGTLRCPTDWRDCADTCRRHVEDTDRVR